MRRRIVTVIGILVLMICSVVMAVGCNKKVTPAGEEGGTYYCVTNDEYLITLEDGNKVKFKVAGEDLSGKYSLAATALTFTFKGDVSIDATLEDYNELTFEYKGERYRFLRLVSYSVTFDTAGGSAIDVQTVTNGKKVTKPAAPAKKGFVFTGWYRDAALTQEYNFDSAVTGDITLYAKYVQAISNPPEFAVNFEGAGREIAPMETVGGIVDINLIEEPTKAGDEFMGWYVSDANDAQKLSYEYKFERLYEDTTLFALWKSQLDGAPEVSVNGGKLSYDGGDASLKIKAPDGTEETVSIKGGAYTIPADKLTVEGEYELTVTVGDKSTTRYYIHKKLYRVSVFKIEGNDIQFNLVENAEDYELTLTAKDGQHVITDDIEIDDEDGVGHYSFAQYDIPADGYKFQVKAKATGYVTSESKEIEHNRYLDKIDEITIDDATQNATWKAPENATSYVVTIGGGEPFEIVANDYSLKDMDPGDITINVVPKAFGWNSPAATVKQYKKVRLAAVKNVRMEGSVLKWDNVPGSDGGYIVYINGVKFESTKNELQLEESYFQDNKISITIVAKGATEAANSPVNDEYIITRGEMGRVWYENGKLKWDAIFGCSSFDIVVNDNEGNVIVADGTEHDIVLTAKNNKVKVKAHGDEYTEWKSITVQAYEIRLGTGFDGLYYGSMYKQKGDPINFADKNSIVFENAGMKEGYETRFGYEFKGFYSSEYNNGGDPYNLDTFIFDKDFEFSAKWEAHTHTMNFNLGDFEDESVTSKDFKYDQTDFEFPVPKVSKPGYVFEGWYIVVSGTTYDNGNKYGNEDGRSLKGFNGNVFDGDVTAYAKFVQAVDFIENDTGFTATANKTNKALIKELTIPAMYQERPVTQIEDFGSCSNMTEINIPDTIQTIQLGDPTVSANDKGKVPMLFSGCTKLINVNIYKVDEESNIIPKYRSENGVLYTNDTQGEINALIYYPYGRIRNRTGEYAEYSVVPGTKSISVGAFYNDTTSKDYDLKTIRIPASVATVDESAVYKVGSLISVYFEAAVEGETEAANLVMYEKSFNTCDNIAELHLPARMKQIPNKLLRSFKKLTVLEVDTKNAVYYAQNNVLYRHVESVKVELAYYPAGLGFGENGAYSIESGVHMIGDDAFEGCEELRELTISASVERIGVGAFRNCKYLKSITFLGTENDIDLKIDSQAFYGASSSSTTKLPVSNYTVKLPANLTTIGANAFGNCKYITGIELTTSGRDTVDFADRAFIKTDSLEGSVATLTIGKDVPFFNIALVFGTKLTTVQLAENCAHFVKDTYGFVFDIAFTELVFVPKDFAGTYTLPSTMTKVPDGMFNGLKELTGVVIPVSIVEIGESAFKGCTGLLSVTFAKEEGGDLTIDNAAFSGCTQLDNVDFPDRLVLLGDDCSYNCNKLSKITLPSGVQSIGESCFEGCDVLADVQLNDGLLTIGSEAFRDCPMLTEITIPASVQELKTTKDGKFWVFYRCKNLSTITVQDSSKYYKAHEGILYSTRAVTENGVEKYVEDTLLYCPEGVKGEVKVPGTVRTVAGYAFNDIMGVDKITFEELVATTNVDEENPDVVELTLSPMAIYGGTTFTPTIEEGIREIVFPQGMKVIGKATDKPSVLDFWIYGIRSLRKIVIPNTVTNIYPFYDGCYGVNSVEFLEGGEEGLRIENGTESTSTQETGTSTVVQTGTYKGVFSHMDPSIKIELPERLTFLGKYAFTYYYYYNSYGATNSKTETKFCAASVTFKDSSEYELVIGDSAFRYSTYEVNLPNNVIKIGASAFYEKDITTVNLSDKLKEIGNDAFAATSLQNVTIPASVEKIGYGAFRNVSGDGTLQTVTFEGDADNPSMLKSIGLENVTCGATGYTTNGVFLNQNKLRSVTFGDESACELAEKEKVGIGNKTFSGCSSLVEVKFPYYIQTIGDYAFEKNTALTTVTFENKGEHKSKLEKIGNNAFDTSGIVTLTLADSDESVTELALGTKIFNGCKKINTIRIPDTVKKLDGVLDNCMVQNIEVDDDGHPDFVVDNNKKVLMSKDPDTGEGVNVLLVYGDLSEFTIPAGATTINASAFKGVASLTHINIPDTVETIGANAFENCINLQTVTITAGSHLKTIGNYAFQGCISLESIELENCSQLTQIGSYAFAYCKSLLKIKFPASLETNTTVKTPLGSGMFMSCYSLQSVDMSDTKVTNPSSSMFKDCISLNTLKLPKANVTIASAFIENCVALRTIENIEYVEKFSYQMKNWAKGTSLSEFTLRGATALGTKMQAYPANFFEDYPELTIKIDDSSISQMTTIPNGLFKNCTWLTSFDFSKFKQITSIGTEAFKKTSITELKLSEFTSLTSIGWGAFSLCPLLETVDLSECTALSTMDTMTTAFGSRIGAFEGCSVLSTIKFPVNITFLGIKTFKDCVALQTVDLTNCIKLKSLLNKATGGKVDGAVSPSYQANTFEGCTQLSTVKLPSTGGVELGINLFKGCTKLTDIDFTKVSKVGTQCFENCGFTSLNLSGSITVYGTTPWLGCPITNLTIGKGVSVLSNNVFKGMLGLQHVDMSQSDVAKLPDSLFEGCTDLISVKFNNAKLTNCGKNIFKNCTSLTDIDLSTATKVTVWGSDLFNGCTALTKMPLPNNITSIPSHCFDSCGLIDVDLMAFTKLTTINAGAFMKCKQLQSVKLPSSVKTMSGSNIFDTCESLTSIDLSGLKDLTTVGTSFLKGCIHLTKVVLPTGFVTINSSMFENCESLNDINIDQLTNVKTMNSSAFSGCSSLTSFKIPKLVTSLPSSLFKNCIALENIDFSAIPDNTAFTINGNAFENTAIRSIDLSKLAVKGISASAFMNCKSLATVSLPNTIEFVATKAFQGCSALIEIDLSGTQILSVGSTSKTGTPSSTGVYVFDGCSLLTTVKLPETCVNIGAYAFANCPSIESFDLSHVTILGKNAFENSFIKDVNLSALTTIGADAFKNFTAETVNTGSNVKLTTDTFNENDVAYGRVKDAEDETIIYFIYNFTTEIAVKDGVLDLTNINVPASYIVKWINEKTEEITKVILPKSMTEIPEKAFSAIDRQLEEIQIPEGVISIGASAFAGTKSDRLKVNKITLPQSLTTIGGHAFQFCDITEITIPANVESIDTYAFDNCAKLVTVKFDNADGAKAVTLGTYVFSTCELLENVDFAGRVTVIPDYAFNADAALTKLPPMDNITAIGASAFVGTQVSGALKFSKDLTLIDEKAFNATNVTSVDFSEVTGSAEIRTSAFDASQVNNIVWPKGEGIVIVGNQAFNKTLITNIEIPSNVHFEQIIKTTTSGKTTITYTPDKAISVFANCTLLKTAKFVGETTCVEISGMFLSCEVLTEVVLGEGITKITGGIFNNCYVLDKITLPESLETIDSNNFANCRELKKLVIRENVSSIGSGIFSSCPSLQEVVVVGNKFLKVRMLGMDWVIKSWTATDAEKEQFTVRFVDSYDEAL